MADEIGPQPSNQPPAGNNQNTNKDQNLDKLKESVEKEIKNNNDLYDKLKSRYTQLFEKFKESLGLANKKLNQLNTLSNEYSTSNKQIGSESVQTGEESRKGSGLTEQKKNESKSVTSSVEAYNKMISESVELFENFKKSLDLSGKRYDELKDSAKDLKDIQEKVTKAYKEGKITIGAHEELQKQVSTSRTTIKEATQIDQSEMYKTAENIGKSLADQVLGKFDLSMQSLNWASIILAIFNKMDMGRILGGYASKTAEVFGKMGSASARMFDAEYTTGMGTAGSSWLATTRFVTDELRNKLLQDFYQMGLQIKGITGMTFASMTNDLIILSEGFKIPLDNIAKYTFQFQDVFRKNTAQAMQSVKGIINEAYNLGVAPERFLKLVADQTEQFKLQRIQISEVSDVYRRFYSGLGVGIEMSEQLTQSVISSLANLSSGKLAAYISLTTGLGGTDLTNTMLNFYRGSASGQNTTNSRLELVQKTLKELQTRFPEIQQNQYVGVKTVMEIFGIQQMEVGVRLYDALSKQIKGVSSTNNLMDEVNDILTSTKSAIEQGVNLIVNILSVFLRLFVGAYKFFTFSRMDDKFLKPLQDELAKYNKEQQTGLEALNTSDATEQGLGKLDIIMVQQAETNKRISIMSDNIVKGLAASIITTGSASIAPGAAASAASTAAELIKNYVVKVEPGELLKGILNFNIQNVTTP
jgi:hypothetical protein